MFDLQALTTADLVLIGLLVAAIFGFLFQRKYEAPKIVASYDHKEPMARRSARSDKSHPVGVPVYDFHFLVKNTGRSPARKVVSVIVEFWHEDDSGALIKKEDFLPVPLRYAHETVNSKPVPVESVDVHPDRPYYWNIGTIPSEQAQEIWWPEETLYSVRGKERRGLPFVLDLYRPPHNQVNALYEGKHRIKVVLYSENSKPAEIVLEINWTGVWKDKEEEMFVGIVIEDPE